MILSYLPLSPDLHHPLPISLSANELTFKEKRETIRRFPHVSTKKATHLPVSLHILFLPSRSSACSYLRTPPLVWQILTTLPTKHITPSVCSLSLCCFPAPLDLFQKHTDGLNLFCWKNKWQSFFGPTFPLLLSPFTALCAAELFKSGYYFHSDLLILL